MQAAKHTLRYLKGTEDLGIHYTRDQDSLSARDQNLNTLYAHLIVTQLNLHLDT